MRGFNQVKRVAETIPQKNIKQFDYDKIERLYQLNTSSNMKAKMNFARPPYCIGEKREEWMKKRDIMTSSQNVSTSANHTSEENETNSFGMR